jgi:hypothetical protein
MPTDWKNIQPNFVAAAAYEILIKEALCSS